MVGAGKNGADAELISRTARALGHPARVRILEELVGGSGSASASSLSKRLGLPLSNVSYHLKVLYEDCEALEFVGSRPVRGTRERFFRLNPSLLQEFIEAAAAALGNQRSDGTGLGELHPHG